VTPRYPTGDFPSGYPPAWGVTGDAQKPGDRPAAGFVGCVTGSGKGYLARRPMRRAEIPEPIALLVRARSARDLS